MSQIQKLDDNNKLYIPHEATSALGITKDDELLINWNETEIAIKKCSPYCVFCNKEKDLVAFLDRHICGGCLIELFSSKYI